MTKDMRTEAALAEARRIAEQPMDDRMEGKLGDEAHHVALRLLEAAGLDYVHAVRLLTVARWERWHAGWDAGYNSGRGKEN